jgi:hypothetical protein
MPAFTAGGIEVWVRLVFLDDSEQTNPPRAGLRRLLAIGAVIVPEAAVAGYAADLAAIRTDLDIPPGRRAVVEAVQRQLPGVCWWGGQPHAASANA